MNGSRAMATMIGLLSCSSILFSLAFAVTRQELRAAKTECERVETSLQQKVADETTALKAAQYLVLHGDVVQDYTSRSEPEIRLCVPSFGDPMALRVQHCMPGEHEVVFPISYLGSDHHPDSVAPRSTTAA